MISVNNCKRAKEIGSYFDIDPRKIKTNNSIDNLSIFEDAIYLSTCRSAIDIVLKNICEEKKIALLPGFTCHAVVEPFINNGFQVIPYTITEQLEININDLEEKVNNYKPNVILIHDYFGFNSNRELNTAGVIKKYREMGIVVINDQTQSMFSNYLQIEADYYLGSIRKWMGIPDGAFLKGISNERKFSTDKELEQLKLTAMLYKNAFLFSHVGTKEIVLDNFKKAETVLDHRTKPYSISDTSVLLINNTDINEIRNKRRENGQILLNTIRKTDGLRTPFHVLGEHEVPFYIPVFVEKERKEFQTYLAKNNVFATVIWACPDEFSKNIVFENQEIYQKILCIPCDQRYSIADMEYIVDLISNYVWENKHE